MIKVLIFDFYGVIRNDEYHDWLERHGFNRGGMFKNLSVNADMGAYTEDQFFDGLSKLSNIPTEKIKNEFKAQGSLNRQLLALILKLKKQYKIALLSNASSSHLRETLDEASIGKLFDEVIISSELGLTKPSREIFDHTLNKLNIRPEEAVFIDDNRGFIEAAKSLGINGIAYTNFDSLLKSLEQIGIIDN